jgi:Icc-related predicted phosphoesterase
MKICAVSDLHEHLIRLPKCELLIIAGDISGWGTLEWFDTIFIPYLNTLKFKQCILVFGNHDDMIYRDIDWMIVKKKLPENVKVLINESFVYKGIRFYGSPNTAPFDDFDPKLVYSMIPDDTDILITHCPPFGIGDCVKGEDYNLGSIPLLTRITQVKPKIHIFGHIHTGKKYVKWKGTRFYNVSILNENYEPSYKPTIIKV